MGHFSLKMACCHNSGSTIRVFFKIERNERGQEVHENCHDGFSEKKHCFGHMGHLEPKNGLTS